MRIPDGGPAFPAHLDRPLSESRGMTLRDWFAGQALAGLIARGYDPPESGVDAYAHADAMLAARSSPAPGGGNEEA